MNFEITKSANKIAKETTTIVTKMVMVVIYTSFFEGIWSFFSSSTTSLKKFNTFNIIYLNLDGRNAVGTKPNKT